MLINCRWVLLGSVLAASIISPAVLASGEHGANIFHAFTLEAATGNNNDQDSVGEWDLDGWVGGDTHKLWLKSEGEKISDTTEQAETWALYSRNIDTFWDAQIGLRDDMRPESTSYVVLGVMGLAPYYFETEAHLFVSQDGDISFRLREENDFLLTQKWVMKPWLEFNLFAQDVEELDTGSGLSDAAIGLQLRYEITRKFAPYLEVSYKKLFGETADIVVASGKERSDSAITAGFRMMF